MYFDSLTSFGIETKYTVPNIANETPYRCQKPHTIQMDTKKYPWDIFLYLFKNIFCQPNNLPAGTKTIQVNPPCWQGLLSKYPYPSKMKSMDRGVYIWTSNCPTLPTLPTKAGTLLVCYLLYPIGFQQKKVKIRRESSVFIFNLFKIHSSLI